MESQSQVAALAAAQGYYELAKAKALSPGGLHLYTFQRNVRARAFYEKHGFTVFDMNDGSRNEEKEPDVRYVWTPDGASGA